MSKFQVFRETAQIWASPDISTAASDRLTARQKVGLPPLISGEMARRRRDGEVKCGDSRIDKFCATFKLAHL